MAPEQANLSNTVESGAMAQLGEHFQIQMQELPEDQRFDAMLEFFKAAGQYGDEMMVIRALRQAEAENSSERASERNAKIIQQREDLKEQRKDRRTKSAEHLRNRFQRRD